jgi:RND family efflux transporter MFP subunit
LRTFARCAAILPLFVVAALGGCAKPPAAPQGQAMQAMPVKTMPVEMAPVPMSDEYVATIKSRHSATINPQVDGNLVKILVHSGDKVKAGQLLMEIDPIKQLSMVEAARATENQKRALYQYNETELERQKKLHDAGIISQSAFDQVDQAYKNSKADYESALATRLTQERQLSYYQVTATLSGIVGDVPVHVGDYVSPSTMLTTVDENRDLEAYIYIPTERVGQVRNGLAVDLLDNGGKLLERTNIDFLSPQVDNQLQGILAKAPVHSSLDVLRNAQLVKARVIWSTKPAPVVPVLAVTRLGGQAFVFVATEQDGKYFARQRAVTLGDTIGNTYAVQGGLQNGDKVIVSGTQMLVDGFPVQPLG